MNLFWKLWLSHRRIFRKTKSFMSSGLELVKAILRVSNLWLNQNQMRIAALWVLSLLKPNQRKERGRNSNH